MQPSPTKFIIKVRREQNGTNGSSAALHKSKITEEKDLNSVTITSNSSQEGKQLNEVDAQNHVDSSSTEEDQQIKTEEGDDKRKELNEVDALNHVDSSSTEEDQQIKTEEWDDESVANAQLQLVVYDPSVAGAIVHAPDPISYIPPAVPKPKRSRVLPSVGAFTAQCAYCLKWRLIPTLEKYEEIRECMSEHPFKCEVAREWRPSVSCADPTDIEQDGSRLWAIDKPNIAQTPPGWQRLLRIRAAGGSKFADVYYVTPGEVNSDGKIEKKKLRSRHDVQKFLVENPEYVEQGVKLSQFSFQTPSPLQEGYVRKPQRPTPGAGLRGDFRVPESFESSEGITAQPLSWARANENIDSQFGVPVSSYPYFQSPPPAKKAKTTSKRKSMFDQGSASLVSPPGVSSYPPPPGVSSYPYFQPPPPAKKAKTTPSKRKNMFDQGSPSLISPPGQS